MTSSSLTALGRTCARICAALLVLILLIACQRETVALPATDQAVPPAVSAAHSPPAAARIRYVCPMHPHIQQHGPGVCPVCGMTLEKKEVPAATAPQTPAPAMGDDPAMSAPPTKDDRRILYYYDPMRPEVHFDKPGRSPFMDMALLPKMASGDEAVGVAVSAAVVQTLGIRIAQPTRREVHASVRVPARVVADARGQARLQSRVSGWIERLAVRAVGQSVSAGSVIAEIYSPELVQAQEELLLGAETAGPATERLRRFGIADVDIQAIRRSGKASRRLPLRAPVSGVVTELGVREGSSVSPDSLVADFSGRNAVWIEAQLFPAQKLLLGDRYSARFAMPGLPGRSWSSDSGTLVPVVDAMTQTLAMRFPISDASDLPLGSVLDAEIDGQTRADVLVVPVSAVIRTAQGDRVLIQRGKDRFVPSPVTLGQRYGNDVEILAGLAVSDRIVTSGQFLLDAEASLQSGLSQMDADAAPAMAGPAP
jgi:membrane fusion protein, copper/silver efflux system